jgi:hypothetical protein
MTKARHSDMRTTKTYLHLRLPFRCGSAALREAGGVSEAARLAADVPDEP